MSIRLTLVCAAAGPVVREVRFDDGPLDDRGREEARAAAASLPPATRHLVAPSRRCRETAAALGLEADAEPALRDGDMGTWRGRSLADVAAADPAALAAWTTDPAAAPHGGESLLDLCGRVADWLDRLPEDSGRVLAITEAAVVRAAIGHALSAPPEAFWRIDVPPLSMARLTGRSARWNLRLGPV
ncbi:histidine phosphatase family protein [Streptomyces sp. 8N706]|uniref:histidine phosphatase family protein n=1 Tax=Streptomyces sp. 8N706 TaxID=3457416 RepID=UPI003FD5E57A